MSATKMHTMVEECLDCLEAMDKKDEVFIRNMSKKRLFSDREMDNIKSIHSRVVYGER